MTTSKNQDKAKENNNIINKQRMIILRLVETNSSCANKWVDMQSPKMLIKSIFLLTITRGIFLLVGW